MSSVDRGRSDSKTLKWSIVTIVIIILVALAVSWVMTRGVEDNPANDPATNRSLEQQDTESTTPNPNSGSTGTGTGTSNDPNTQTPSPAGGIDTNAVPSGNTSPAN